LSGSAPQSKRTSPTCGATPSIWRQFFNILWRRDIC